MPVVQRNSSFKAFYGGDEEMADLKRNKENIL